MVSSKKLYRLLDLDFTLGPSRRVIDNMMLGPEWSLIAECFQLVKVYITILEAKRMSLKTINELEMLL